MGIDLSIIWFVIIVFATLMYIVMDGFDLGIGILFPATQNADDRDVMVNSVAPVWDGNETWLVLGGAALFGAFPLAYGSQPYRTVPRGRGLGGRIGQAGARS